MTFDNFYSTLIKIIVFFIRVIQRMSLVNEIFTGIIKEAERNQIVIGKSKIQNVGPKVSASRSGGIDDDEDIGNFSNVQVVESSDATIKPAVAIKGVSEGSGENISTYQQMIQESNSILSSATELTHTRCAKLIAIRAEQNTQLNPIDFYRLFNAAWEFVLVSEQLFGKMGFGLKGSILAQAKSYLNHFHEERMKQITLLLENEQWVQADIPIDFQHMTEQLQLAVPFISPTSKPVSNQSLHQTNHLNQDHENEELDLTIAAARASNTAEKMENPESATSSQFLIVDGVKYYAVVSVLLFLKMLTDYLKCAQSIGVMTPDVLTRIYEFLKVLFKILNLLF